MNAAYNYLPAAIVKRIPKFYETENVPLDEKMVWLKYFTPDANWTWFVTELDPETNGCFGYVDGFEGEWGYFNLDELEEVRGPLGLPIERDIHFNPCRFSELKAGELQ